MPQVMGSDFYAVVKFDYVLVSAKTLERCRTVRVNNIMVTFNPSYPITFMNVAVSSPVNFLPPEVTVKAKLQPL